MPRKSKREIEQTVQNLRSDGPTDIEVTTEIVEITEENPDPDPDIPEDAHLIETESPAVTVWREES